MRAAPSYDVVVPTLGRPSLAALLDALAAGSGPRPVRVLVVHDRPRRSRPRPAAPVSLGSLVHHLPGRGAGPAAARNVGWRAATAEWVAFLDDDVVPPPDWAEGLADDLAGLGRDMAGSQGRVQVPLPHGRRPTDWERNVAGLEGAWWATADMAYRRAVLAEVGGFDERFRRAYREDADLALRVQRAGYHLRRGRRQVAHPVRPAPPWVSVALQAGNADDVLMTALHGAGWREAAGAPPGRLRRHLAVTTSGLAAVAGLVSGRRGTSALAGAGWVAGTAELAWARIRPGPRTPSEVLAMAATSAAVPLAAAWHWAVGQARHRPVAGGAPLAPGPAPGAVGARRRPRAVLLDRDGTLVRDVPYNGEPAKVEPMPEAREALDRLRAAGVPLAVVSNQSGVARGLLTPEQLAAVNRRVEELLGPLGPWFVCTHGPQDGCGCRKPAPGLVVEAAGALGVDPAHCALIGDIGADVEAARAAGARAVLVPTPATRADEVAAAPEVAGSLLEAVELLLC